MSINNLSDKSGETVSTKRLSDQEMLTLENGLQKDHEVEEAIGQTNENISSLYKEISPLKKHIYAEVHTSLASRYKEKDNKDQTVHQQHLQSFAPLLQNDYGKAVIIGKIEQMTFGYESFRERLASGKSFSPYQENLAMLYLHAADLYEGAESNESQEISLPILDTTKLQASIALFTQIQQHIAEYTQYTSSGLSKSPQELVSALHPENDFARTHALAEVLQKTDVVQKFLTADQPFADLDDIATTPQEHAYLQLYLKITRSSSLPTVQVSASRSLTADESPTTPKQPDDYTDRAYYLNPAATSGTDSGAASPSDQQETAYLEYVNSLIMQKGSAEIKLFEEIGNTLELQLTQLITEQESRPGEYLPELQNIVEGSMSALHGFLETYTPHTIEEKGQYRQLKRIYDKHCHTYLEYVKTRKSAPETQLWAIHMMTDSKKKLDEMREYFGQGNTGSGNDREADQLSTVLSSSVLLEDMDGEQLAALFTGRQENLSVRYRNPSPLPLGDRRTPRIKQSADNRKNLKDQLTIQQQERYKEDLTGRGLDESFTTFTVPDAKVQPHSTEGSKLLLCLVQRITQELSYRYESTSSSEQRENVKKDILMFVTAMQQGSPSLKQEDILLGNTGILGLLQQSLLDSEAVNMTAQLDQALGEVHRNEIFPDKTQRVQELLSSGEPISQTIKTHPVFASPEGSQILTQILSEQSSVPSQDISCNQLSALEKGQYFSLILALDSIPLTDGHGDFSQLPQLLADSSAGFTAYLEKKSADIEPGKFIFDALEDNSLTGTDLELAQHYKKTIYKIISNGESHRQVYEGAIGWVKVVSALRSLAKVGGKYGPRILKQGAKHGWSGVKGAFKGIGRIRRSLGCLGTGAMLVGGGVGSLYLVQLDNFVGGLIRGAIRLVGGNSLVIEKKAEIQEVKEMTYDDFKNVFEFVAVRGKFDVTKSGSYDMRGPKHQEGESRRWKKLVDAGMAIDDAARIGDNLRHVKVQGEIEVGFSMDNRNKVDAVSYDGERTVTVTIPPPYIKSFVTNVDDQEVVRSIFSVMGASEQFKNERNSIVRNIVIEARKKAMDDVLNGTITMERKNEDGSVTQVALLEAARQGCEFNLKNMISSNGFKKESITVLSPGGIDRENSHFSDEELNPEGERMRD